MRPLLTICIPTYGRAETLARLLEHVALEAPDVPVLVSDNGSPDSTPDLLRRMARPGLVVHRQPSNLGSTANIRWLLSNALDAEYTWMICDDDLPAPGAIAAVREILAAEQPAWLHLPHRWLNGEGKQTNASPCPPALERFAGSGDLYRSRGHWLTFASAAVIRRDDLVRAARSNDTRNEYAPLIWFVDAAGDGPCVVAPFCAIDGGIEIHWIDMLDDVLTVHYPNLYEAALHRHVDAGEFAVSLDRLFGGWRPELWRGRDGDQVADVLRRFPRFRVVRRAAAEQAAVRGDRELLEAAAAAVSDEDRAIAAGLRSTGEHAAAAGDLPRALALLEEAVNVDPLDAEAWNDLGVVQSLRENWKDAIFALEIAVGIAPELEDACENLAALRAA